MPRLYLIAFGGSMLQFKSPDYLHDTGTVLGSLFCPPDQFRRKTGHCRCFSKNDLVASFPQVHLPAHCCWKILDSRLKIWHSDLFSEILRNPPFPGESNSGEFLK